MRLRTLENLQRNKAI
uniref:Uncharacterized protein n=1 Tax=Anguilla anguilla TaxID=7936 RepID=A0A0E9W1I8_ANGAN